MTEDVKELARDVGDEKIGLEAAARSTLVGRFGARSRLHKGENARVVVDTRALHFFDADTGLGIYDTKGAAA